MRKILLIFCFVIVSNLSYSQIESGFGLFFSPNEAYGLNSEIINFNKISAVNQMRYAKGRFALVSDITIYMHKSSGKLSFTPTLSVYDLSLRYDYKQLRIEIKHRCIHPNKTKNKTSLEYYGGFDKIGVSWNLK